MARLRAGLEAAASRHGRLIAILGEAGLGKTRLIEELESEGATRGMRILLGRAYEAAQILSYGPWADALRGAGVVEDEDVLASLDPIRRAELSRVLPGVSSSPPPAPAEPVHAFEAIAGVIERLSRRQPVLVVLEDLQWGDELSVRFLGFLGRRIQASPIFAAVTVRDEDLPEEKSAHRSAAMAYQQALVALNHLPVSDLQRARACDLHFARAYSLGWSGAIDDSLEDHERSLALAEALGDESRLQRSLTGTCSALSSTGRHREALRAAERALAIVTSADDLAGQFWVNINLARICYALGDYRRALAHGRQAENCLGRAPAISGAVTRDLPPPVAYRSWLVLALTMLGDFPAGIALARELTTLVASMDWPRARLSALVSVGNLLTIKGDFEQAINMLEPSLSLCREAELWAFLPRIAAALGTALALSGRPADGLLMLGEAVSQSRTARYMYEYAGLLCDLGMVHLLAGHLDDARQVAAEALALSRVQGARASEATALRLEGQVATQSDPLHEASALASLQEALSIAETLGARPRGGTLPSGSGCSASSCGTPCPRSCRDGHCRKGIPGHGDDAHAPPRGERPALNAPRDRLEEPPT
jgi:tetratricopeptide (TPR) repeat protein